MAIKGKGRTRGRRVVAAPPRPPLLIRKKPFYARRSVWIVAGVVALAAILFAVFWGMRSSGEEAKQQREEEAVDTYTNLVQGALPPATQPLPPTGFLLFPELPNDLNRLGNGQLSSERASKKARDLEAAAKRAGERIGEIKVREVIPEEFPDTRLELLDSQFLMVQAFETYERIAGLMRSAARAPEPSRKAIAAEAQELVTTANDLFQRGNQALVNVRTRLGIQEMLPPQGPEQLIPPPNPSP